MRKRAVIILGVAAAVFVVLWMYRIWIVNQDPVTVRVHKIGEVIDKGTFSIEATEADLLGADQFEEKFGVDIPDIYDGEYQIICVCLNFRNSTDHAVRWDEIFTYTDMGFETVTWASMIDPLLGNQINILESESLEPGGMQEIWYVTPVNRVCFKDKNWENIRSYDFYYVLSLSPDKETIALDIR